MNFAGIGAAKESYQQQASNTKSGIWKVSWYVLYG